MMIATLIVIFCRLDTGKLLETSTFKSGMAACVCVLGVAWLGDTFVNAHLDAVKETAAALVSNYPWLLAVAFPASAVPAVPEVRAVDVGAGHGPTRW